MGLTLAEAKKHSRNPQEVAIITELSAGPLLSNLPFREVQGSGLFWRREENLGDVGFRSFNDSYDESYAEVRQYSEALKLFGGDIRVDRAIVELEGPQARAFQIQAKVRAMRLAFEALFFNGDSNSTAAEFDGLALRLPAAEAGTNSQVIANDSSAAALDLNKLDEAIDAVDAQGGSKYLLMSKSARRHLSAVARASGQIDISRSEFGGQQLVYSGIPVLEVDRDHKNVRILDSTPADQSIYVVSFGNDHLTGIQNGGPQVRDLGEATDAPELVTRVEWFCGVALLNGRAAARLTNVDATA
ncbi:MAG: major capsid protein, partial [Aquiluna sp.]